MLSAIRPWVWRALCSAGSWLWPPRNSAEEDPKVAEILSAARRHCGACGFPGCAGLASAIVGAQFCNVCIPEGTVADKIASIMGVVCEGLR